MQETHFLKKILLKYKYQIIIMLIMSLFLCTINILNTYIIGKYIDILVYDIELNTIYFFTVLLFVLGLLNIIISNFNNYISTKTQTNMVFDINLKILKHVKKLPISFFDNKDPIYLNQRINSDSNALINFSISSTIQLITQIIIFIIIFFILGTKNFQITIVTLLSIPMYLALYFLFKKKLYKVIFNYKEEQNKLFSNMNKHLFNISFIKLNSLFDDLDKELLNLYPNFLKSLLKYIVCNYSFFSIISTLENIFNVFLFFYGGIAIFNKKMTIGDFIIIKSYYSIILNTISNLTNILKSYPEAKVCHNRITEILSIPKEKNGEKILKSINSITLENLDLKINKTQILKQVNYKFELGKVYIIKGVNGSGKSSLIKSVLGLYLSDIKGKIMYNDTDINNLDLYHIRKKIISFLDQEPVLLHSTIYENLTQDIDNINFDNLYDLINKFNLNLPESDKKRHSYELNHFSGGEKQKISLIRILMKETNLIIMDEPTSALDSNSINILKNILMQIQKNKIIIIVSHDERIYDIADTVINFEDINSNYKIHEYVE